MISVIIQWIRFNSPLWRFFFFVIVFGCPLLRGHLFHSITSAPSLQDKNLWEDLCQLEGCLGMRYLTHETEDNFWTSHGAKPHPLAKAEAEKRPQIMLEQEQQRSANSTPSNPTVTIQEDQLSNGSYVSNESSKPGSDGGGVFSNSSPCESRGSGSGTPTQMQKKRKDYISMSDEEVMRAQEHAKRVGYKVSTV